MVGLSGKDLVRVLPRPDVFKPTSREEEHVQWRDWYWSFKQYICTLDDGFRTDLETLERHVATEDPLPSELNASSARGVQLYSLLAGMVRGRALQIVRSTPNNHGYEALRRVL